MNTYMEPRSARAGRILALCLALLASVSARAVLAADAPCKPVFDAIPRLVKTPNHQYLTQSSDAPGSLPHASEMIFTGKTTYILHDGKWQTSPTTPEETLQRDEENRKNSKMSCGLVRSESVDGVSTSLYTVHSESEFGRSDGQIWISKADALPVHQKIDLAADGTTGKTHIETRFVYSGAAPPVGVK